MLYGALSEAVAQEMKRTSNVQRPTSNVEWKMAAWITMFASIFIFADPARAEATDLEIAVQPMEEGVPQVAVMRLRALLSGDLAAEERQMASAKLGEALLASGEAE
jgi:hypothetical protein